MQALKHPDEEVRLQALYRYNILDSPTEADFDDITRLASQICDAPISVVNLIDRDRQFFKSEIGLGVRETPLDISICAHAILEKGVMIVPDTQLDPRFDGNPLVTGDPYLRFYAGALLESSDGYPLGTLCILDSRPRTLTELQINTLRVLARQVMTQIELRYAYARERKIAETLQRALLIKPPDSAVLGWEVATLYTPALDEAQVGGDFYDVVPLPENKTCLVVGDVSGKGLTAAAHMARAKFTLRVYLNEGLSPADALTRLNAYLVDAPSDTPPGETVPLTFVALAVAIVDGTRGTMTLASAGIEPPLLRRANGRIEVIENDGPPVGIDRAARYTEHEWTLGTDDLLLMTTDGITEARQGRTLFGYERMQQVVEATALDASPQAVGDAIVAAARAFSGGNLGDDVCVLLARRRS